MVTHGNDEAFKMAVTDAPRVLQQKMIGVGADVYRAYRYKTIVAAEKKGKKAPDPHNDTQSF